MTTTAAAVAEYLTAAVARPLPASAFSGPQFCSGPQFRSGRSAVTADQASASAAAQAPAVTPAATCIRAPTTG